MQNKPQPMQVSKHLRRRSAVTKSGCRCCCRCAKTAQYISASGDIFYINVVQDAFIYARTATIVPTRESRQKMDGQGNEPTVCCLNRGAHANIKSGFYLFHVSAKEEQACVYGVHEIILTVDSASDRALCGFSFLLTSACAPFKKVVEKRKARDFEQGHLQRCDANHA